MHSVNISTLLLIISAAVSAELFFNVPVGLDHNAAKAAFIEHGIQGYDPASAPTTNGLVAANGNSRQLPHEAREQPAQLAAANAAPLQGPPPGRPVAVPLAPARGPPNVPVQAVTKGNVVLSVSNTVQPHAQPVTAAAGVGAAAGVAPLSSSVRAPQATGAVSAAPKAGMVAPIAGAKSMLTSTVGSDSEDGLEEDEEIEDVEESPVAKPAAASGAVAPVKSATVGASTSVASVVSNGSVTAATSASAAVVSTSPANAAAAATTTGAAAALSNTASVIAPALTSIVAMSASTTVPVAAASAVTAVTAVTAPVIAPVAASGVLVATAITTQTVMAATASISVPVVKSLTLATVSAMTATTVESATNTDIEETDAPAAAVAATATADPSLESVEPASASSSSGGVKLKPLMFANRANMSAFKPDDLDKFTFPSAQPSVNLAGIGKGGDAHANSASDAMRMENSGRMGFQGSMPADEGHKTGAKPGSAKPTGAKPHVAPTGAASGRADASKSGANKSQSGSAGDENSAMSQRSPIGLQLMAIVGAAAAVCGGALF